MRTPVSLKWSCLAVYLIFRVNIIDTLSDLTRMQIFAQIVSCNLTQMIHWRFVYIIHMNCIDCIARSYYQWQFTTGTHTHRERSHFCPIPTFNTINSSWIPRDARYKHYKQTCDNWINNIIWKSQIDKI